MIRMTVCGSLPVSIHSRRIGVACGCFDLFHPGHRRFLYEAHKFCDYLIVAVNDDDSVRKLKGPGRPFDGVHWRMDQVSAWADMTLSFGGDVRELLAFKPGIVIRGWDQDCFDLYPEVPVAVSLSRYLGISTTQLLKEKGA